MQAVVKGQLRYCHRAETHMLMHDYAGCGQIPLDVLLRSETHNYAGCGQIPLNVLSRLSTENT